VNVGAAISRPPENVPFSGSPKAIKRLLCALAGAGERIATGASALAMTGGVTGLRPQARFGAVKIASPGGKAILKFDGSGPSGGHFLAPARK